MTMQIHCHMAALLAGAAVLVAAQRSPAQSLFVVQPVSGFNTSSAFGLSPDGTYAVGNGIHSTLGVPIANVWTVGGGGTSLGLLNGVGFGSAIGASNGGQVIVGEAYSPSTQAWMWTSAGGMQGLGFLPGDTFSRARDVSADGTVIVGNSVNEPTVTGQAFRYTALGGMQGLGTLAGHTLSSAEAVSANGLTIVGHSGSFATERAFRWTEQSGMVQLPFAFLGTTHARDVSADGSIIVGDGGDQAVIWNGGVAQVLNSMNTGRALGVSGNGSIVVGEGRFEPSGVSHAFIHSSSTGTLYLSTYLQTLGVNLNGFDPRAAFDISLDGRVIAGTGVDALGQTRAFVAVIPTPSTLVALAAITLLGRARRRQDAASGVR